MLQNAIVSLHPAYNEMIRLRAIEDCISPTRARQLSISVAAAKTRYYRAVQDLSRALVRQTRRPAPAEKRLGSRVLGRGSFGGRASRTFGGRLEVVHWKKHPLEELWAGGPISLRSRSAVV